MGSAVLHWPCAASAPPAGVPVFFRFQRVMTLRFVPKATIYSEIYSLIIFCSITCKSLWHIQTLNEFSRKMRRK